MPSSAPSLQSMPPAPSHDEYLQRLSPPQRKVRIVIDTDAANEIDDQFALAWALLQPERLETLGIYAAPYSFAHRRAQYVNAPPDARPFDPPDLGMLRSLEEIQRIQSLLGMQHGCPALAGSPRYLSSLSEPIHSDATEHLIATARAMPDGEPLYVLTLGCPTNVSSALRIAPDIARKIVVVWTSAYPSHAPHANQSFNLEQDVLASQYLYDSGVPLVYLPGYHVGAQLRLSLDEMHARVRPQGAIGQYLHSLFTENPLWAVLGRPTHAAHSWVIWDMICVAWVLQPAWVPSAIVPTPRLSDKLFWQTRPEAHPMREGLGVARDAIFNDFFNCLAAHAGEDASE
jgi:purine nucleosidase